MDKLIYLLALLWIQIPANAQDENLKFEDYTYLNNIKSVRFHVDGLLLSYPILNLNSQTVLHFSFDDLSPDYRDFTYTVVHCDANWKPSALLQHEYIRGFYEERIDNYDYSFKTKSIYTHYSLYLPNRNMQFIASGNYLLKVYVNEGRSKKLAVTKRFVVVDNRVSVSAKVVKPAMVSRSNTHQEIDFTITHKGFEIRNPRQELSVAVLQNGRWDNAISGLTPMFSRLEEQIFDFQDKIVFPAGKEYRYADLRSMKYGSESIQFLDYAENKYEATLYRDEKRGNKTYLEIEDINGNYVIETLDDKDHNLEGSYIDVLFSLASAGEMQGEDVYLFGSMTDWQLKPEFKMVYNPMVSAYVTKVLLKQGYYNYSYAALPKGTYKPDFEVTEGDWFETNNTYTILVYYKPFGSRYDQLIGAYSFGSRS
jgi:hypothetical protein